MKSTKKANYLTHPQSIKDINQIITKAHRSRDSEMKIHLLEMVRDTINRFPGIVGRGLKTDLNKAIKALNPRSKVPIEEYDGAMQKIQKVLKGRMARRVEKEMSVWRVAKRAALLNRKRVKNGGELFDRVMLAIKEDCGGKTLQDSKLVLRHADNAVRHAMTIRLSSDEANPLDEIMDDIEKNTPYGVSDDMIDKGEHTRSAILNGPDRLMRQYFIKHGDTPAWRMAAAGLDVFRDLTRQMFGYWGSTDYLKRKLAMVSKYMVNPGRTASNSLPFNELASKYEFIITATPQQEWAKRMVISLLRNDLDDAKEWRGRLLGYLNDRRAKREGQIAMIRWADYTEEEVQLMVSSLGEHLRVFLATKMYEEQHSDEMTPTAGILYQGYRLFMEMATSPGTIPGVEMPESVTAGAQKMLADPQFAKAVTNGVKQQYNIDLSESSAEVDPYGLEDMSLTPFAGGERDEIVEQESVDVPSAEDIQQAFEAGQKYEGLEGVDESDVVELPLTQVAQLLNDAPMIDDTFGYEGKQFLVIHIDYNKNTGLIQRTAQKVADKYREFEVSLDSEPVEYDDSLEGGLADKKAPGQFDEEQLQKGVEVEMEHTDDPEIAMEIAMDHLLEDKDYYKKLPIMEGTPLGEFQKVDKPEDFSPRYSKKSN